MFSNHVPVVKSPQNAWSRFSVRGRNGSNGTPAATLRTAEQTVSASLNPWWSRLSPPKTGLKLRARVTCRMVAVEFGGAGAKNGAYILVSTNFASVLKASKIFVCKFPKARYRYRSEGG